MKILIVSDSHGNSSYLEKAMEKHLDINLLIHLGDVCGEADYIEALSPCPVEIISGNNDYFVNLDREKLINVCGVKIFVTHGHYYRVNEDYDYISKRGKELGVDIVMFGHTHIPYIDKVNEIYCVNPGSISLPRQWNKKKTYIIMSIHEDGKFTFDLNYIE